MALTVQNLRAVGTGVEPASLLSGQICFNLTDKILYVGDGSNFKTNFDGTQVPGVPGNGWYAMPMDFDTLGDYFVANPLYYGDTPTDQQVLTWSTVLNHPIWTSGGGGGGGNQVYVVTNAAVAAAPGTTTSDKITAALGVASPDEGDVTIVTGLPDDVYEGLYFFAPTEWVKGAAYAYPSASEVIYDNTAHPTLSATVQGAIDDLDDGLIATTAIANTANSTANSALSIASAALPKAGGTMTGTIVSRNINVQPGNNITFTGPGDISFSAAGNGVINGITDSVVSTSSTLAASANALRATYDVATAAVPCSSFTNPGDILLGSGVGTYSALPVGPVGSVLIVGSGGVQWAADTPGDVTSVTATAPITVDNSDPQNPIVGVDLATTTTPGVVQVGTNVNVSPAGVISINNATTSQSGVVQLNNTLASTSTTEALTAAQGAALQTQINGITISGTVTLAGSIDANTGLVTTVTSQGALAVPPFVVNQVLPSAGAGNDNYYVIVTNPGTFTPPGGSPVTSENGDWILSDGVTWQELAVGARPAYASTTTAGVVVLSTDTATQNGVDPLVAVTPVSLQSKISDSTSLTNSFRIASSTAVKAAYDIGAAAIPCATITAVGDIVVGGAGPAPTALPVGANGQVLVANSACATGLEWVTDVPGDVTGVNATFPITVDNTDPQQPTIGINGASTSAAGAVQLNDTVTSTSVLEAATANAAKTAYDAGVQGQTDAAAAQVTANAAVPCSSFLAKGNILGGTAAGTYSALAVGTNGQVLLANSACSTGLEWGNACYVPDACFTAKGQLIVGTGAGTYVALSPGSNGQILVPNSACTNGVEWITSQGALICGYTCTTTLFNTALGANAGDSITTGIRNTVVGYDAGTALTSGGSNALFGYQAGDSITTGAENVAIGPLALTANVSGNGNVAIGRAALISATGSQNTAVGYNSQSTLTSGVRNTTLGAFTGADMTTATDNTLIGNSAGDSISTGTYNTIVGSLAGCALTLGGTNILIGANAGDSITTGFNNTIIGDVSGSSGLVGNLILAAGTTVKFQANNSGAWSPDGTNYGTAGQFLASNGTVAAPSWCTLSLACIPCSAFTASGQLLAGTGTSTFTALTVGTDGQFLVADSTCTGGLKWATECFVNDSSFTGTGAILAGTGVGSFSALTVGTNGQFLTVDSTCANGVKWVTANGANICGFTCALTPFNTVIGATAGAALTSLSVANTAIGFAALDAETTGDFNTAIGHNALTAQNGPTGNTAVGGNAGAQIVGGACNTLMGYNTGDALTTGSNNTALGMNALGATISGGNNVAVGMNALATSTVGCQTAVGYCALASATTGIQNTGLGYFTLNNLIAGNQNTAVGFAAGQFTSGNSNTYLGYNSGNSVTTSSFNTMVGWEAGVTTTNNGNNTYVGACSGRLQTSTNNTAVGTCALANTGVNNNTAVGFAAGAALTTGSSNTFVGAAAGDNATTADNSVAVGYNALGAAHTPNGTVAIGANALAANTSGACNTAVGFNAGTAVTTGSNNTMLGYAAGDTVTTGTQNTFLGSASGGLAATTSEGNTGVGFSALGGGVLAGAYNTAVGNNAGLSLTSGATNTFVGYSAGSAVTTGGANTLIGRYAGTATLSNNVVLSDGAGTIKLQINQNGAVGVGTTPSYGTSGQILTSAGTGAAAAWSSSLPQVTAPTASTDAGVEGQIASDATYFYMYTGGRWQRVAWDATVW